MAYDAELIEARETLALSTRTASMFVAQLGALNPILLPPFPTRLLGRPRGFQATVCDHRYWFAKLYEIVTWEELNYSLQTQHPGFSLHFMKVFYSLYYSALQSFLRSGVGARISPLWMEHFRGLVGRHREVDPCSIPAIQHSVRTGAIAHIQGDMPVGLAETYNSWATNPKPSFQELREDFIENSERAFIAAQARFYIEVNDKTFSPVRPEVGQLGAAVYQQLFAIQPSLEVMFQWRRDAWDRAARTVRR
jgi:hypothetical protein